MKYLALLLLLSGCVQTADEDDMAWSEKVELDIYHGYPCCSKFKGDTSCFYTIAFIDGMHDARQKYRRGDMNGGRLAFREKTMRVRTDLKKACRKEGDISE